MLANFLDQIKRSWSKGEQTNKQEEKIIERVRTNAGKTVQKIYIKKKPLGKGAFAQCYITENTETKQKYATKIIAKQDRNRSKLLNELLIHQLFHHDNIVDFSHAFEDKNNIYVFMQLCQNDTLEHLLQKKRFLETKEIQSLFLQIIQGVMYIHQKNVIHRDLKPRNIFLGKNNQVKIGDFGLAAKLQFDEDKKRNICGTTQYMSPEMVQGKGYGKEADIWSLGILLYEMHTGKTPFIDLNNEKIMENVCNLEYSYNQRGIPKEALALIKRILIKNPQLRPTLVEILESRFFGYKEQQTINLFHSPRKANGFNLNFETPKNNVSQNLLLKKKSKISQVEEQRTTYVTELEEVSNDIALFQLSNMSFSVLKKDTQILLQNPEIIQILLEKNGKSKINHNPKNIDNFLRTSLDYFKKKCKRYRNSMQNNSKQENKTFVYVTKVTRYKNCFLLKLSNQIIQIRFSDKTNILIKTNMMNHYIQYIDADKNVTRIKVSGMQDNRKKYKGIQQEKIIFAEKILISITGKQPSDFKLSINQEKTRGNSVDQVNKI